MFSHPFIHLPRLAGLLDCWLSLRDNVFVLITNRRENGGNVRLEHHAGHYNLIKDIIHLIAMENEIKFTNILEAFIQGFYEYLNQVKYSQIGFLLINCKHEEKSCIRAIDDSCRVTPFWNCARQIITKGIWTLLHLLENATNNTLLDFFSHNTLIKLRKSWLPMIVNDQDAFDHI